MKKLKNWLGKMLFLASLGVLRKSMNWFDNDKTRLVAIDALINTGKTAQIAKDKWNF